MQNTTTPLVQSPEAVMSIVTKLQEMHDHQINSYNGRMLPRIPLVESVLVQLLDEEQKPCSETLTGVSLDYSIGGLGVLLPEKVEAKFALIQFHDSIGSHMPLLMEVRYEGQIGPFYKLGGSFCVDWFNDPMEIE